MKTQQQKDEETARQNDIEQNKAKDNRNEIENPPKKERTPNTIYTLKQMRNMINKIALHKMANVEELTQLRNIHKAMTERWIGIELAKPLE